MQKGLLSWENQAEISKWTGQGQWFSGQITLWYMQSISNSSKICTRIHLSLEKGSFLGIIRRKFQNGQVNAYEFFEHLWTAQNLDVRLRFALNALLSPDHGLVHAKFKQYFYYLHDDYFIDGKRSFLGAKRAEVSKCTSQSKWIFRNHLHCWKLRYAMEVCADLQFKEQIKDW